MEKTYTITLTQDERYIIAEWLCYLQDFSPNKNWTEEEDKLAKRFETLRSTT